MFAKLLKYEWRSNASTFWILSACALGVSILGGVLMNLAVNYGEQMPLLASTGLMSSIGLSFMALFGYVCAVWIILLVRFYKSRFTDEGYLTFTLPVTSRQVFLSAALNMLFWSLISLVVLVVCITLLLLISQFWKPLGGMTILLSQLADAYVDMEPLLEVLPLYIINGVLEMISAIVIPLTCLTVGSVIAKKHKILAAFGIYYGISMIVSFVTGIGSVLVVFSQPDFGTMDTLDTFYSPMGGLQILLSIGLILGGYFTSTYLMQRELNLN